MSSETVHSIPRLYRLPATLPPEGAIRIEIEEGVPIFRASDTVQARIEMLLSKRRMSRLSVEEEQELDSYEEIAAVLRLALLPPASLRYRTPRRQLSEDKE